MNMDASSFVRDTKKVKEEIKDTYGVSDKLATSVASLQSRLGKAAEVWGKSATEAELYRLAAQGVPEEALQTARALAKQIEALEHLKKTEAEAARVQEEFTKSAKQANDALVAAGKSTFANTRTQAEKYKIEVEELRKQLDAGAISQDTFNRAVKKLKPKTDGVSKMSQGLSAARGALGGIGKAFAVVGGVAVAAGASFAYFAQQSLTAMDDMGDLAGQIGVSVEGLTGLSYAAELTGSHGEDVGDALKKMNANLAEAASGAGPAADALDRIGLSGKELSKLAPDEAFKKISGGFDKIPNSADKAAIAMAVFGKSGQNLINTLNAGPAEIQKMIEEGKKLGAVYGKDAADMAGAANDAITRLTTVFSGLGNKIAVEVAPYVVSLGEYIMGVVTAGAGLDVVAKNLDAIGISGKSSSDAVGDGWTMVGDAIGVVADAMNVLKIAFLISQSYTTGAIGATVKALGYLGQGIGKVISFVTGMKSEFGGALLIMGEECDRLANEQIENAKESFQGPWPSEGIRKAVGEIKSGAAEAKKKITEMSAEDRKASEATFALANDISALESKLKSEIATIGMTTEATEIYALKQRGANDEVLASLTALQAQKKALDEVQKAKEQQIQRAKDMGHDLSKDMLTKGLAEQVKQAKEQFSADPVALKLRLDGIEKAKGIIEGLKTPFDEYQQKVKDIKEAFSQGDISRRDYVKGLSKAQSEYSGDTKYGAAMNKGSQEARSAILAYNGQSKGMDAAEKYGSKTVSVLERIDAGIQAQGRQQRRSEDTDFLG